MTLPVKNISISINRSKEDVYQYASDPENFPKWLAFVKSISKKSDTIWEAETSMEKIEIDFTKKNEFGIIDHTAKLPDGTTVNNPLRAIANKNGSEVVFTLFQMPGKTDNEFEHDADLVKTDLSTLKKILETK